MSSIERVLGFDEALAVVLERAAGFGLPVAETHSLLDCLGRVLAEPVTADRDQPPFDRSTRDGFAVRAGDASSGRLLRVMGQVRAGERWSGAAVVDGTAVEIMTGAPLPEGADAVVMVEHVEVIDDAVRVGAGRSLATGENVVPQGSEARAGDGVIPVGTRMDAAEVALAAACGYPSLKVFAKPAVAIVATGDELVEIDQVPAGHEIRNSNSYGIAALVMHAGGRAERLAVARDRREELLERVTRGRRSELLIFSGGVSMGKYDLVEEVLAELDAEFFFTGVMMQPGKPVVFGRLPARDDANECYFFGLPGNPVSTQVTFHCFVEPMVRALGGEPVEGLRFVQAVLTEEVRVKPGLTRFLPARLTGRRVKPEVGLVGWQGSGDLAANARANCYAVVPAEGERMIAGDSITVLLR